MNTRGLKLRGVSMKQIKDIAAWFVTADQRFRVGNRVRFNSDAEEKTITRKGVIRGGISGGTIIKIPDAFSVVVEFKGRKNPQSYHHGFFDLDRRPKR